MIIRRKFLQKIASGDVDLAFRRWQRPTVKSGGRLRTAIGVIAIDAVEEIDETAIDGDAARRSGYSTREELIASLDSGRGGTLYRIRLRLAGPDPRVELRECSELDDAERANLERRLARNVRKLKELGLTESLEVGYRLSPRGRALLGR